MESNVSKFIQSIILFLNLLCTNTVFAQDEFPDNFSVIERWISATSTFDLVANKITLGSLYRELLTYNYSFYNANHEKTAIADYKFFSLLVHFDIYDREKHLLGVAEEKVFSFFPSFKIYANDGKTALATASMDGWGTTFTIYDPVTNQIMGYMQRPYFRVKNDWQVKITNRALLESKQIDFRVLMTVIAFQGDYERWNKKSLVASKSNRTTSVITADEINLLDNKIAVFSTQTHLDNAQIPDEKTLEVIARELNDKFTKNQMVPEIERSDYERLNDFIDFCLGVVSSEEMTTSKKKGILHLLSLRLNGTI